jgi:Holliday junction resolvasome RuvABC endonuclease subunit
MDEYCILAIDPGLTGAMAVYYTSAPDRVSIYDMPVVDGKVNAAALRDTLRLHRPDMAVIERVGPMPRDGVAQAWRFSAAYATAQAVCALSDIPMTLITPAAWKKAMKVAGGPAGKEQCRALAIRLFPVCSHLFARKKDAGRAEAALLAYHYQQIRRSS